MGIFEKLNDYLERNRDLAELDALSDADLADFAASPADLRAAVLARPGVRAQLLAMVARYGLTEDDINAERWREQDVVLACQNCKDSKQCQRFLDGKRTSFLPEACPNAETYSQIAAEKA